MKIPLLISGNPINCQAPVVYLPEGEWVIKSNHQKSHILLGTSGGLIPLFDGMKIKGDNHVRLRFETPHNEVITVEAHSC